MHDAARWQSLCIVPDANLRRRIHERIGKLLGLKRRRSHCVSITLYRSLCIGITWFRACVVCWIVGDIVRCRSLDRSPPRSLTTSMFGRDRRCDRHLAQWEAIAPTKDFCWRTYSHSTRFRCHGRRSPRSDVPAWHIRAPVSCGRPLTTPFREVVGRWHGGSLSALDLYRASRANGSDVPPPSWSRHSRPRSP